MVAALRGGGRVRTKHDGDVLVDRLVVLEQRLRLVAGDAVDVGGAGAHLVHGVVLRDATRGGRDAPVGTLCADVHASGEIAGHAAGCGSGAQRTLLPPVDAGRRPIDRWAGPQSRARAVLAAIVQRALRWQVGIWPETEGRLLTSQPRAHLADRKNFFDFDFLPAAQAT